MDLDDDAKPKMYYHAQMSLTPTQNGNWSRLQTLYLTKLDFTTKNYFVLSYKLLKIYWEHEIDNRV